MNEQPDPATVSLLIEEPEEHEISSAEKLRITKLISVCTIFIFLSGMLTVGFNALLPILLDMGVYKELCKSQEQPECPEQRAKLDGMLSTGGAVSNMLLLVGGIIHDNFGPKIYGVLGSSLMIIGCMLFGYSSNSFDGYYTGFALIGTASGWMFFSTLHYANALPSYRGRILNLFRYSEPVSALVFVIFNYIYFSFDVPLSTSFQVYCIIPLVYIFFCVKYQPKKPYTSDTDTKTISNERYITIQFSLKNQILQVSFALYLLYTIVGIANNYLYEGSVRDSMLWITDNDQGAANNAAKSFAIVTVIANILSFPVGFLLDRYGTFAGTFFYLFLSTICYITSCIKSQSLQIFVSYPVYFISRATFLTTWSHFGLVAYGKNWAFMAGLTSCIAGFFTFFDNFFIEKILEGNYFIQARLISLSLILVAGISFAVYVKGNQVQESDSPKYSRF